MEEKSKLIQQHSALKSILLHLVPGIFILIGIFLFSIPVFPTLLGIDTAMGPMVGFLLSALIILVPIQISILLYEGKRLNGKISLKGVIGYTEKSPIKQYAIFVPILLFYCVFWFVIIAPFVNEFMINTLFWWYPQEFNFQNIFRDPVVVAGYQGVLFGLILYIIIGCILAPFVEELYFRGYLLPRMEDYAKNWAPVINAVLFSLYHFFSPWENPIRIVALIPMVYVVWRKKDIRFGILVHVILNTFGGIIMLISLL